MERQFAKGIIPDLSVLNGVGAGKKITMNSLYNGGHEAVPQDVPQESPVVQHVADDYTDDKWVTDALQNDPVIQELAKKMGVRHG